MAGGQFQTVQIPKRIQLVSQAENRSADLTKDPQLINCFAEKGINDDEYWLIKRPGLSNVLFVGGGLGKGVAYFEPQVGLQSLISIVNNTVYSHNLVNFVGTPIGATIIAASAINFFTILTNSIGNQLLIFGDGTTAYFTDGVTVTQIVTGFPIGTECFRRGIVYLDGTLYVFRSPNAILGTQNLDDPTTWDPLNLILARTEGDFGVALAKHTQYVVALKQWTTDFFYNAGNPTGSPLTLLKGATLPYGCYDSGTVQEIEGSLLWVSSNRTNGPQVSMLTRMQHRIVSSPAIERLLKTLPGRGSGGVSGAWSSQSIRVSGHSFYIITTPVANPITLVFDLTSQLWYRWTSPTGTEWTPRTATYVPYANTGWKCITQDTSGNLYEIAEDYTYSTDSGSLIPVDIYTVDQDFGSQRTKQLAAMYFKGDIVEGSILRMRWSDDNYQTWSNYREMDLSVQRPSVTDCGSFYRRAWNFNHSSPTPFRLKTSDMSIDLGTI